MPRIGHDFVKERKTGRLAKVTSRFSVVVSDAGDEIKCVRVRLGAGVPSRYYSRELFRRLFEERAK